ncbi:hypothetical protein CCAX7_006560 [Capsulimonas corticalis]|uniref:Luciferase domain-containing protein n=1 Tax=Capsulimonas corticalis TaxID=2219043 RepID=A0A402D1E2_9BACT|nr:luciferase family protein [Capsulimonas corticalis]BDI28605.1 hypothetical protein CCAX7_006560 [Capsulimonas corticalis]
MFRFVTTHLQFLGKVPGLVHVFEAVLILESTLLHRPRLAAIRQVRQEALSWPGVTQRANEHGGTRFDLGRREIGHMHGNGLVDILFTKAIRDEVISAGAAEQHHLYPKSNWVSLFLQNEDDARTAAALLRRNYERLKAL